MSDSPLPLVVEQLIGRSNRIGSDPRNTNYAGGNTSAKGRTSDFITGEPVDVMWVKGSGGDLGTLTADGLSVLRIDQMRSLKETYRGVEHEDEMQHMLDHCVFGPPGSRPSIDTAMHGLLEEAHVDHLHPDSVIAIAAASDGEELTRRCFGGEIGWLPWKRPGFELALMIERLRTTQPGLRGVVLGGHGLTTWGETSQSCEETSLEMISRAADFLQRKGRDEPLGRLRQGFEPLAAEERREQASELSPVIRGMVGTDGPVIGRWFNEESVVDFIGREAAPRLVPLGTSCPDHFIRTKIRPLLLDLPPSEPFDVRIDRLKELHAEYREEYERYYHRFAVATSPPMRGANPAIVLVPGVGMFSFGSDGQTARVAGEFYINAINVIRGAEAVSSYEPISEREKFGVEYWSLEQAKLDSRPPAKQLSGKVAFVTGAGSGIGRATAMRLSEEGAVVVVADVDMESARATTDRIGSADRSLAIEVDVTSESEVRAAIDATVCAYGGVDIVVNNAGLSLSKSLVDTSEADWDLQHDVMAKGSYLVSKHAARALIAQGTGGSIIYIVSKNAVVAGPNNVAYSSAKASQAHQVRLLAAELGEHGIRVNGVNPDGVVQGSGIFKGEWAEARAAVHGVETDELGKFYASRTLLKQEVLPEHVANAVFALVGSDLSQTTGSIIPVDSGVAAAFMR